MIDAERARLRAATTRTSTAACTSSRCSRTDAYEAARGKVQTLPGRRARAARSSSLRGTTEAINLVAQTLRPQARGAGRRGADHRASSTTRTSCPGRCSARRRGPCCGSRPSTTRARSTWTTSSGCSAPRTKIVAVAHVSNALGTDQPRPKRMTALAHARGRAGAGRRRPGRAPPGPSTCVALDCDFYAFSGHKLYGPSGSGRALRQGRAARGDAALAGRRRHDRLRHLREDDLQRAPLQVRGGHPEHRRGDRPRRGHRLRDGPRARRHRRPRGRAAAPTAPRCSWPIPGLRLVGTAPREGGRALLRARRHPPPRHRHRPRLRGHRGPHRPPLRPAGDGPLRHARHRARLPGLLQHAGGAGRAGRGASARCRRCSL